MHRPAESRAGPRVDRGRRPAPRQWSPGQAQKGAAQAVPRSGLSSPLCSAVPLGGPARVRVPRREGPAPAWYRSTARGLHSTALSKGTEP